MGVINGTQVMIRSNTVSGWLLNVTSMAGMGGIPRRRLYRQWVTDGHVGKLVCRTLSH
jgi:hypothetical protein